MKEQELLGHLLDLARRLDFEVRTDQGPFRDGACRLPRGGEISVPGSPELAERRVIVLNRNSPPSRRIAALSQALSQCSLEGIFLLPAVREAIENALAPKPENPVPAQDDSPNHPDEDFIA